MGVRDITDEFRRSARKSFRDLQRALNDRYCWKCPQRTVRSITGCRELDAWVRLRDALEDEVSSFISESLGEEALDRVKTRMRERKLRRELRILKINDEYLIVGRPVGLVSGDLIIIGSDIHILRGLMASMPSPMMEDTPSMLLRGRYLTGLEATTPSMITSGALEGSRVIEGI